MKKTDAELISDFIKGAVAVFKGIFTVLSQAFKKRVTLLYPEIKPEIPDCPKGAINMTKQYELATDAKKDLILDTEGATEAK